jgi:hypothetical protein
MTAPASLENGRHRVRTHVTCTGVARTGEAFLVTSEHEWEVADYGGLFPRICKVRVRLTQQQ